MMIEVPLPDLAALPVWTYVTGGVWAWYVTAAAMVRAMRRWGWLDESALPPGKLYPDGWYAIMEDDNTKVYETKQAAIAAYLPGWSIVVWFLSPALFPLIVAFTALWSSAHVASLGLVPRPWSKGVTV